MQENINEKKFLEEVSETYKTDGSKIVEFYTNAYINKFDKLIRKNGLAVELGCGYGYSTKVLADKLEKLVVIEGSENMIRKAKVSAPENVEFNHCLFENINETNEYDYVFANYVLEHVEKPKEFIEICYRLLKKDGLLFITVPNAKALSRQIAVEMELFESIYSLTENDINHGHRRVYDLEKLNEEFNESKFEIIEVGGTFVKPVSDYQFDKMIESSIIDEKYLNALSKLSEKYLDLSGSIYIIAKK